MIRAAIYGNSVFSAALRKMIHKIYNKIIAEYGGEALDVVAYMKIFSEQNEDDEIPVISIAQAAAAIKAGEIEVLLVPRENYAGQNDYLTMFLMLEIGLDNVYIARKLDGGIASVDAVANMFTPYYQDSYLPYLEFHTADHCNLNCAACEHYSGLVSTPVFTVYDKFERDLFKLKEFIDDIGLIRILGGEPLLNKEIEKYIKLCRKVYPNTDLLVVTNGLLLFSMPDTFFETLNQCNAGLSISYYPPLENRIDDLIKLLDDKKVTYQISDMVEKFRKVQTLVPNDDEKTLHRFTYCFQKGCVNLYDGKLAACFLPFTTKYFNEYFDQNLPENEALDLYGEDMTIEKIKHALSTPFERCRYCDDAVDVDWCMIHKPSVLEDWIK